MVKVEVHCPSCKQAGLIEISEDLIKNAQRGVIAVRIAENVICEHAYIAYVDKNLKVRDYFMADFEIELPDIAPRQLIEEKKVLPQDIFDVDLIKLNVSAIIMTYTLKALLSKQPIIIIFDEEFLHRHILNFFEWITQDCYMVHLTLLSIVDYMKNKKRYKNYIVLGQNKILKDSNKILNPKKIKIEKKIIEKFFNEHDSTAGVFLLKNEIQKTYELAKAIMEYFKSSDDPDKIIPVNLINYFKEIYHVNIQIQYLRFSTEIVKDYFEFEVPKSFFLSFLLF